MTTTQLLNEGLLTYADYASIDDGFRYELIQGKLFMAPPPSTFHQSLSTKLTLRIAHHVEKHKLGSVFAAPTDVILANHSTVQPDILFVSNEHSTFIEPHAVVGSPDLIVEIISPGSVERDRYQKRDLYEKHGVREYWLVDPANKSIEILVLKEKGYQLAQVVAEKGNALSHVIKGLRINHAEIMPQEA